MLKKVIALTFMVFVAGCQTPTDNAAQTQNVTAPSLNFAEAFPEAARAFDSICVPMLTDRSIEKAIARAQNRGYQLRLTGGQFRTLTGIFPTTPRYSNAASNIQIVLTPGRILGTAYNGVSGGNLCGVVLSDDYASTANGGDVDDAIAAFVESRAQQYAAQSGFIPASNLSLIGGRDAAFGNRLMLAPESIRRELRGTGNSFVGHQDSPLALTVVTYF